MSYIPFMGMESGNLSKLVKGKFLEMFLNIVIKNGLNQYRKKCARVNSRNKKGTPSEILEIFKKTRAHYEQRTTANLKI